MAETHAAHPTPRLYWTIALILGVITAIEIAASYLDIPSGLKVTTLLVLGAVKFLMVVAFFMHLKFEKNLYRSLFFLGAIGAIPLFVVVLLTFRAL
ncbi:MAG TPA: cytochrome C oxidase subunit IV family protein [Acidimicrobiia bacterium]